jgi:hypothetical protein
MNAVSCKTFVNIARLGTLAACFFVLAGCVVSEVRPQPKLQAIQASQMIAQAELLDVAVVDFDPGVPQALLDDEEELEKRRVYPEVRRAESRLLAVRLKETLENTGQWGAVRVVPPSVSYVDVTVTGQIVESTGSELSLRISAQDASGRIWIDDKTYQADADLGSYKTQAALKARDPFQNIYVQIADDLLAARQQLNAAQRREVRQIAELRFAADLDPASFTGYVQSVADGKWSVVRLPATDDPALQRIRAIRERDAGVIDTLDGYNQEFSDQLFESYGAFRRTSREAIERADKARNQAMTRTVLGAAAVLGSIFVGSNCSSMDYNCRRIDDAVRTAGVIGGTAAVMSGIKKFSDAKIAAQEVRELADSFEAEVAGQVVEVEGRSLKLTGTAEEQYREWRRLLAAIYREETVPESASVPAP